MIRFRDTKNRNAPPPWLTKAVGLQRRADPHGTLWACGDAYLLGSDGDWCALGDGYEVAGPVEDQDTYRRESAWLDVVDVQDLSGREWVAPRILDASGERAFRVSYGADFLPHLSPEQYRYVDIAKAARDGLATGAAGVQDVPMPTACRWAAELLCAVYHLPPGAIGHLCILDDLLVTSVLGAAIGLGVEVAT